MVTERLVAVRLARRIAFATAALTALTATIAVMTPPGAGPWCTANCFTYPYHDIAGRYPRDYLWMVPAILLSLLHVALYTVLLGAASESRRTFARLAVLAAAMSALVLIADYYV